MKLQRVKFTKRNFGGGGGGSAPVQNIPDWMRPAIDRVQNETGRLYDSGQLNQVAGTNANLDAARFEGAGGIISSTRANEGHLSAQMGRALDNVGNQAGINANNDAVLEDQMRRLSGGALDGNEAATNKQMALALAQQTASNNVTFGANGTLGSARNVRANADAASESGVKAAQQIFNNQVTVEKGIGENADRAMARYSATEKGITENAQSQLGLLTGATNTVANLGQQQRAIEQQIADAPWQGLQRAASTIYGNPARQTAAPSGGK